MSARPDPRAWAASTLGCISAQAPVHASLSVLLIKCLEVESPESSGTPVFDFLRNRQVDFLVRLLMAVPQAPRNVSQSVSGPVTGQSRGDLPSLGLPWADVLPACSAGALAGAGPGSGSESLEAEPSCPLAVRLNSGSGQEQPSPRAPGQTDI